MRVGSSMAEDNCGICDGDGSDCTFISKVFTAAPKKSTILFNNAKQSQLKNGYAYKITVDASVKEMAYGE